MIHILFWKEFENIWPELSLCAIRSITFGTSSISVERSFAQARVIHSSQRGKQGHLAFRIEMFCKFNFWCLEEILLTKQIVISIVGIIIKVIERFNFTK